jgi:murein DD-endopeptidase MepM/ murein hydrolase activator NlpD
MTTDRWLIVVAVLVLLGLAGAMHLHTLNTAQAQRIAVLEGAAEERARADAALLHLQAPVDAPVSSPAGWRTNPMGGGESGLHKGTDYACPVGTPVRAAGPGVVVATWPAPGTPVPGRRGAYYQGWGVLGAAVLVDHGGGVWTIYGHLSRIDVRRGQRVGAGEVIALSGATGQATGPHLHFEVVTEPERVR